MTRNRPSLAPVAPAVLPWPATGELAERLLRLAVDDACRAVVRPREAVRAMPAAQAREAERAAGDALVLHAPPARRAG